MRKLGGHMSEKAKSLLMRVLIDANLKRAYQQTVNEELPERFVTLISRLRAGEFDGASPPKGGEGGT